MTNTRPSDPAYALASSYGNELVTHFVLLSIDFVGARKRFFNSQDV